MQIITGRKNLVWVTRGLPTEGRSISGLGDVDFTNRLRLLNESLRRAQISVYPAGGAIDSNNYKALDEMASLTGFGAVGEALRESAADSRASYQQSIRRFGDQPACQCDPTDILIRQAQNNRCAKVLLLLVPYGASAPGQHGTPMSVDLNVLQQQYLKQATVLLDEPGHPVSLQLDLTQEEYSAAASSGIALHGYAALGTSVQSVRVILVDGELGAVGAMTVPVRP